MRVNGNNSGSYVKRSSRSPGNPVSILSEKFSHLGHEYFWIQCRNTHAFTGFVESRYIHVRPEQQNIFILWSGECFQTFKNLLSVMKDHCSWMQRQVLCLNYLRRLPSSICRRIFYRKHVLCEDISKT